MDHHLNTDTGESLLQLEIRKCQQAFAMSSHDEPEEFEDIQFFHRLPSVAFQSFKIGASVSAGDIIRGGFMSTGESYGEDEGLQDSESSLYAFPDNVLEYGEPQFFPGNCVGYLETILEETDEDYEEEEGSSGRHWWTADSDTDTDSVIRIDQQNHQTSDSNNPSNPEETNSYGPKDSRTANECLLLDFFKKPTNSEFLSMEKYHSESSSSTLPPFSTTASSTPFEMEDLYLFDQLDLAFEETLMKPRRRTGFAFEAELHLPLLEEQEPVSEIENSTKEKDQSPYEAEAPTLQIAPLEVSTPQMIEVEESAEDMMSLQQIEEHSRILENEDEEPSVVNEEDFFCSSPSSDGDDSSGLSETETSETTSSTSGSEDDKKSGIILAEFSMSSFNGSGGGEMYQNNHAHSHRRSYEVPTKIRSFRSFDSLNNLAGTELLFSNADTFPPADLSTSSSEFQYIKEVNEHDSEEMPSRSSGSRSSRSSSTDDKVDVCRKNSVEVSSENLSEDSGIHDLVHAQSGQGHEREISPEEPHFLPAEVSYIPESAYALNPFIYSSASEENSMLSYNLNTTSLPSEQCVTLDQSSTTALGVGEFSRSSTYHDQPIIEPTLDHCIIYRQEGEDELTNIITTTKNDEKNGTYTEKDKISIHATEDDMEAHHHVNNVTEGVGSEIEVRSGPMSTLSMDLSSYTSIPNNMKNSSEPVLIIRDDVKGVDCFSSQDSNDDFHELSELISSLDEPPLPHQQLRTTLLLHHHRLEVENSKESRLEQTEENFAQPHNFLGSNQHYHHQYQSHLPEHHEQEETAHFKVKTRQEEAEDYPLHSTKNENPLRISILSECESSNFGNFLEEDKNRKSEFLSLTNNTYHHHHHLQEETEPSSGASVSLLTLTRHQQQTHNNDEGEHVNFLPQTLLEQNQEFEKMELDLNSSGAGVGIPIKTYGGVSNNDIAVYLVTTGSRTPSPTVPIPPVRDDMLDTGSACGSLKTKTVHFSPVVSEICWRESYAEPSSEDLESYHNDGIQMYGHKEQAQGYPIRHLQNHTEEPRDHDEEPIKVHVHSQILSEPLPMVIPLTEKERLMTLEPQDDSVRMPMSIVPDLVSQCEKPVSQVQLTMEQSRDEVDASLQQEPPYHYQQQIFPSMFVASANETKGLKNGNQKKNGKKTYVTTTPPLGPVSIKSTNKNIKRSTENENIDEKKDGKSKPSFFQRLSKIRLSGNKPKQPKSKIYPKEIEALNSKPKVIVPLGPILKNSSPTPVIRYESSNQLENLAINQNGGTPKEHDECSEAFESILEEIAGLNTILQRQQIPLGTSPEGSIGNGPGKRSFAERKQFMTTNHDSDGTKLTSPSLDIKLSQFKEEASKTRDQISKSHPDLEIIEGMIRRAGSSPRSPDTIPLHEQRRRPLDEMSPRISSSIESKKNEREWYRLLRSAAEKYYHGGRGGSGSGSEDGMGTGVGKTGIVETDLDTGRSRELLDAELVMLDELDLSLNPPPLPTSLPPTNGAKAQSLTNLTSGLKLSIAPDDPTRGIDAEAEERAKSLEFLLDEEQKNTMIPPENQLRQENRQLSEHELRVQRSLQKIHVPEWYRKHSYRSTSVDRDRSAELLRDTPLVTANGTTSLKLLKRTDYGSAGGLAGGWAGLSTYRTPSLSSLQNSGRYTGSLNRSNFVRGRPVTMSVTRSSRESLLSPSSTASQSPSAFERASFTYGMPLTLTRFGKGRMSSTSETSPGSVSPASTLGQNLTLTTYVKKPYLGWRSQERLNTTDSASTLPSGGLKLSAYRPPAERLAADILTRQKKIPVRPTGSDRPPLPKPIRTASENLGTTTTTVLEPTIIKSASQGFATESKGKESSGIQDSIKEVTDAINEFVAQGSEGQAKQKGHQKHVKKQALWFESSFVGKKTQSQQL